MASWSFPFSSERKDMMEGGEKLEVPRGGSASNTLYAAFDVAVLS